MSHATRHKAAVDKFKKLLLTSDESSLGLAAVDEDFGGEVAQAKRNSLIDLPVPAVSTVADYASFTAGGYVQPRAFIRRLPVARPELLALTADGGEARAEARARTRRRPPPSQERARQRRRRPSPQPPRSQAAATCAPMAHWTRPWFRGWTTPPTQMTSSGWPRARARTG